MGGNGVVVFEIGTWRMASRTWRVREGGAFDDGFLFSGMVMGKVKGCQDWLGLDFLPVYCYCTILSVFCILRSSVFFVSSKVERKFA